MKIHIIINNMKKLILISWTLIESLTCFGQFGLDSDFASNGLYRDSISSGYVSDISQINDGNLILAKVKSNFPSASQILLTKIDLAGNPVSSYGINGVITINSFTQNEGISLIHIQKDGSILCVISPITNFAPPQYEFAVRKFKSDGTVETTFGINGTLKSH